MKGSGLRSVVAFFYRFCSWLAIGFLGGISAGIVGFNLRSNSDTPFALDRLSGYREGLDHLLTDPEHQMILLMATGFTALVYSSVMYVLKHYVIDELMHLAAIDRPEFSRKMLARRLHWRALYFLGLFCYGLVVSWLGWIIYVAYQPFDRSHMSEFLDVLWRPCIILSHPDNHPWFGLFVLGYVLIATLVSFFFKRTHKAITDKGQSAKRKKEKRSVVVAKKPTDYQKRNRRGFLGRPPKRPVGYQYDLFLDQLSPKRWWHVLG